MRGRVNGDLKRLYLLNDGTKEIILHDPFLDTELFTEGKDRLCEYLNIKSRYRKKYKWPTVKEMLKEQGYKVSDDNRRNNKRYAVISLPIMSSPKITKYRAFTNIYTSLSRFEQSPNGMNSLCIS